MAKVDLLLTFILYQQQHPHASDEQIAQEVGITTRYLYQCREQANLLKHHLSQCPLTPDELRVLMSVLNQRDPVQREIHHKLERYFMTSSKRGVLRMARPNEEPPLEALSIGELMDAQTAPENHLPPQLAFWLGNLLYEPLFRVMREGDIQWRLATACDPVKGYSQWLITMRKDIWWSDGKPITPQDVIDTLKKGPLASMITRLKTDGKTQLLLSLSQAEPLFPLNLNGLLIRPAHSSEPYRVTSSPYRLKRFCPEADTFRLVLHRDSDREQAIGIDWLTLKRFTHPANAIRAIHRQEVDVLPLRAVQLLHKHTNPLPPQQLPFFGESYYLLILNRHRGPLADDSNCRALWGAINYPDINCYLHDGKTPDKTGAFCFLCPALDPRSVIGDFASLSLKMAYDQGGPTLSHLAKRVGKVVRASVVKPVRLDSEPSEKIRQAVDVLFVQLCFGHFYRRLSQYFHSTGRHNTLGYANPHVDALLNQLDQTADLAKRQQMGQHVLSLLQDDVAVILLSPCSEYVLSPLELQFDSNLSTFVDLAQHMSRIVVERHCHR